MSRRDIALVFVLAVLAIAGTFVSVIGPALFPGYERLIFWGALITAGVCVLAVAYIFLIARKAPAVVHPALRGGRGGKAAALDGGEAYGGPAGDSGIFPGGDGGDVIAIGAGSKAGGGQGGGAPKADGTPGKGGVSGYEVFQKATGQPIDPFLAQFGRGGDGGGPIKPKKDRD